MKRLLVVVVLALAACGSNGGSGVPWKDYPTVQDTIDGMAARKDCVKLQGAFDQAEANNAGTMTRTGHNNAALMRYIDDKMRSAGCR